MSLVQGFQLDSLSGQLACLNLPANKQREKVSQVIGLLEWPFRATRVACRREREREREPNFVMRSVGLLSVKLYKLGHHRQVSGSSLFSRSPTGLLTLSGCQ